MRFLIGTRKGLFRLERRRGEWRLGEPHFLGVPVNNAMRDPRDGSIWALIGHGHWGPKLHVSRDDMKSFEERTCPVFPEGYEIDSVTDMGEHKGPAAVKALSDCQWRVCWQASSRRLGRNPPPRSGREG